MDLEPVSIEQLRTISAKPRSKYARALHAFMESGEPAVHVKDVDVTRAYYNFRMQVRKLGLPVRVTQLDKELYLVRV